MENNKYSSHKQVTILMELLREKGVTDVVLSPGSRNAPLLIAAERENRFRKHIILDERSAAFYALGIAQQSENPVALICTSGTALLNYGPAIAEAYYQGVPLLILSADRPTEWLDQDDSQTIAQYKVLTPYVKSSYQLPVRLEKENDCWYTNRVINEAINQARNIPMGPVHINIPLEEPLYTFTSTQPIRERIIEPFEINTTLSDTALKKMSDQIQQSNKIMIIIGFHNPTETLDRQLNQLISKGVVVLTETISNCHLTGAIAQIDRTLAVIPDSQRSRYAPDLLIVLGGAIVSRHIKTFIRNHSPKQIWYAGSRHRIPDGYQNLTHYAPCDTVDFLSKLNKVIQTPLWAYSTLWKQVQEIAYTRHCDFLERQSWCDLKLFECLSRYLPQDWNIQVSNSTPIRYMQLFDLPNYTRMDCNRGTSGIDGSTSTAIGAAAYTQRNTLLITGDNSFLYDSNALAIRPLPKTFKAIVIDNGGGAIFRFLPGSSQIDCVDQLFQVNHQLDLSQLATAYGFAVLQANNEVEFITELKKLLHESCEPTLLVVKTTVADSGQILKNYFQYLTSTLID